jgi:SNF2 family DNA or RNA helicase
MAAELLLKVLPRPHQIRTAEMYRTAPTVLNGSEMGTGKSLSVIMRCLDLPGKCLIVVPASLCLNWKDEFAKFSDEVPSIHPEPPNRIHVVSQDIIHKTSALFKDLDLLAIDECQGFCNITSRRSKAMHSYVAAYKPKNLVLMSGTPMQNRIPELYSLFMLMDKVNPVGFSKEFPNQWIFNTHYTHQTIKKFGQKRVTAFEGFRNVAEMRDKWLKNRYIRFKLAELTDIPDVQFIPITAPIPCKVVDDEMASAGWEEMDLGDTVPDHVATAKLSSAMLKVDYTVNFCMDLLTQKFGPLVVFSDHVEPARKIAKELGAPVITGETPMAERQTIVRKFQDGAFPVVVGTIGALGTGFTLTKSNICVVNDMSYIPAKNAQAAPGRIRRIGQDKKCLVYQISRIGIDSRITEMLVEKMRTIKAVFD